MYNVDLWRRIRHGLHSGQRNIRITWVKGHATDEDFELEKSIPAHTHEGNDEADIILNTSSRNISNLGTF